MIELPRELVEELIKDLEVMAKTQDALGFENYAAGIRTRVGLLRLALSQA